MIKVRLVDWARLIYAFSNRSSVVISIGTATLADVYDPAVRGKKVGIINASVFFFSMADIVLYRSWELTTLHHWLDRYTFYPS